MDLMKFIDSKDVRAHLQKLGHQLTSPEAAMIILDNDSRPIPEKLAALWYVTEHLPDRCFDQPYFVESGQSLHEFLTAYIAAEEAATERFFCAAAGFALYEAEAENDDCSLDHRLRHRLFTDARACLEQAITELKNHWIDFSPRALAGWRIRITKCLPDETETMQMTFNAAGEPLYLLRKRETWLSRGLRELFKEPFTLPLPFADGDLAWLPRRGESSGEMLARKPILLYAAPEKNAAPLPRNGFVSGYYLFAGQLQFDELLPATRLEYLPEDYPAQETAALKQLRRYLNHEISLCALLGVYAGLAMQSAGEEQLTLCLDDKDFDCTGAPVDAAVPF